MISYSINELRLRFKSQTSFNLDSKTVFYSRESNTGYFLIDFKETAIVSNTQNEVLLKLIQLIRKDITYDHIKLYLIFSKEFEQFSSNFISTLFLFKNIFPDIKVDISIYGILQSRGILLLIQNLYAGFLSFGFHDFFNVFTSNGENELGQKWSKEPSDAKNKVSSSKYTISSSFSPLLLISKGNFRFIFEDEFKISYDNNLIEHSTTRNSIIKKYTEKEELEFYQFLRIKLISEIDINNTSMIKEYQEVYYLLHYYKFLSKYRLLINSFENFSSDNIQISYFELYSRFLKDTCLLNKPLSFILLFSLIGNSLFENTISEIQKSKGKSTNRWNIFTELDVNQEIINSLYSIFFFVNNTYGGIYELAKNIVQHSEYQLGVISMRLLNKVSILQLKDDNPDGWNSYFNSVSDKALGFFIDISILDIGTAGIFTTYEKGIVSLLSNSTLTTRNRRILTRDLHKIQDLAFIKGEDQEEKTLYRFFNRSLINEKQKIITNSSYGTYAFLEKIKESSGTFTLSTNKYLNDRETSGFQYYSDDSNREKLIYFNNKKPFGTSYDITIPINLLYSKSIVSKDLEPEIIPNVKNLEGVSTSIYSRMLTLKLSDGIPFPNRETEILDLVKIEADIICIDCSNINDTYIDYSNFTRQLGAISMELSVRHKALVLYNLSFEIACNLWNFLLVNRSSTVFWSNDKNLLIQIYYNPPSTKPGYYFSFFLIGSKRENCEDLNDYFALNHYVKIPNVKNNDSSNGHYYALNWKQGLPDNHPLFHDNTLLYSELFIRNKVTGLTYFEENAKTLLLTPIESGGFNMQNIHLRIGSKIHLKDFIVAKRFFQNNNYSTGFAFLMAECIMQSIILKDQESNLLKNEYVILGYGYYSELMVSRTEAFLNEIAEIKGLKGIDFSHFIVEDSEEMKIGEYFSIYKDKIKMNSIKNIVIVPISSTLTTQLEIENRFTEYLKNNLEKKYDITINLFAKPFFTVTVVGDELLDSDSPIRKEYWETKQQSDRILITKNVRREIINGKSIIDDTFTRENRYFVYLPSKWYYPDDCEMCGLDRKVDSSLNISNSKPLFIADKVSVTPSLIWNLPIKNKFTKNSEISINIDKSITIDGCKIDSSMMQHIHKIGTNKHFNFYFNYLKLFVSNRKAIKDWVSILPFEQKENILLITPEKSSNGPFVNIINKELFNDKADIMNFSPSEIAIEDFLTFFKSAITRKKKIFYVDNLLATGSNFFSVNNFLVSYKSLYGIDKETLRFSGIITLIDRLGEIDRLAVNRTLSKGDNANRVFSFVRFNLPVISSTSKQKITCYLCEEEDKYTYILKNCNLDCIKQYIRDNNLKKVSKNNQVTFDFKPNGRETLRFAVSQILMNLYNKEDFEKYSSKTLLDFIKAVKSSITVNIQNNDFDIELKISIIKVLANPPFINYKEIKVKLFEWVYTELHQSTSKLYETLNAENIQHNILSVQYLKVLIKLASKLQVNYLISKEFLTASNKIIFEFERNKNENIRNEIQSLKIFITSCIKELLNFNPYLCIVLEKEIGSISPKYILSKKYFDLLTLENTEIIGKAIEIHNKAMFFDYKKFNKEDWYKIYNNSFDELCKEISKLKGINDFIDTQANKDLKVSQKNSYLYTAILHKYIESIKYNNENNHAYQRKIDSILVLLSQIIGLNESHSGACFVYRDSGLIDNKAIIISSIGNQDIPKNIIDQWVGSYCEKMMEGLDYDGNISKHYYWSSAPFSKVDNIWKDNFGEVQPGSEKNELIFGKEINRLYFLRLSDWADYMDFQNPPRSNAILVFYDRLPLQFNSKLLRYAVFIREKISSFVKENFTENTAFWGWIENKQKVEEFSRRYRKNTHGVYGKINSKMHDPIIYNDSELLQIFADLIIGKFHYNLLSEQSFEENVESGYTINEVLSTEIRSGLRNLVSRIAKDEAFDTNKCDIQFILSGSQSIYSKGMFIDFILTSLTMNALKYKDCKIGTIITISNDNDYLYISNTNASELDFLKAKKIINSITVPYESISLYVINKYFENEYKNSIEVDFDINNSNTFTIKLPITKK